MRIIRANPFAGLACAPKFHSIERPRNKLHFNPDASGACVQPKHSRSNALACTAVHSQQMCMDTTQHKRNARERITFLFIIHFLTACAGLAQNARRCRRRLRRAIGDFDLGVTFGLSVSCCLYVHNKFYTSIAANVTHIRYAVEYAARRDFHSLLLLLSASQSSQEQPDEQHQHITITNVCRHQSRTRTPVRETNKADTAGRPGS